MTLHVLDIGSSNVDCRTFSPHYREGWQISTYDSDRFEIGAIGWWEQRPGWLPE